MSLKPADEHMDEEKCAGSSAVHWTPRFKLRWKFDKRNTIFVQLNEFENISDWWFIRTKDHVIGEFPSQMTTSYARLFSIISW